MDSAANILMALNQNVVSFDELDASQALLDLSQPETIFDLDEMFAQPNDAKHITNIVRNSHANVCTHENSRKRFRRTYEKVCSKSKFQKSFDDFELSHFSVQGPYVVPYKITQDCFDGLRSEFWDKMAVTTRKLKRAYEFGIKHLNVWHPTKHGLIPNFLLCANSYCNSFSTKVYILNNIPKSAPNDSLIVCNVGTRSFFIIWNESEIT